MARPRQEQDTAAGTANGTEEVTESQHLLELFDDSTTVRVNVRRLEPTVRNGVRIAGWLPTLTLSREDACDLPTVISRAPGFGGGLYFIQPRVQRSDGKEILAKSFRIQVAGPDRALELPQESQVKPEGQQAQQPPMGAIPAAHYPWYPPPAAPQHMAPSPTPQDIPRLVEALASAMRGQQTAPAPSPQMDLVAMVQALQRTVQPEDELSKFAKFAALMDKLRGPSQPEATPVDWAAIVGAAKEFLRPQQPQPRQPQPMPRQPPPAPVPVAGPPGWFWRDGAWHQEMPASTARAAAPDEDEPGDPDESEENDAEPLTADEILAEFAAMRPEEQARLRAMAADMLS